MHRCEKSLMTKKRFCRRNSNLTSRDIKEVNAFEAKSTLGLIRFQLVDAICKIEENLLPHNTKTSCRDACGEQGKEKNDWELHAWKREIKDKRVKFGLKMFLKGVAMKSDRKT